MSDIGAARQSSAIAAGLALGRIAGIAGARRIIARMILGGVTQAKAGAADDSPSAHQDRRK